MSLFTSGCVVMIGICLVGVADTLFFHKKSDEESDNSQNLGGLSIKELLSEEHEIDMEVLRGGK